MRLNRQELEQLIPNPVFARGETYFQKRLVELQAVRPRSITARVAATEGPAYTVVLKRTRSMLTGTCTCPAFSNYGPCKHLAAAGLAMLQYRNGGYLPSDEYFSRTEFFDRLQHYFAGRPKKELVAFLMELARIHPELMFALDEQLTLHNAA